MPGIPEKMEKIGSCDSFGKGSVLNERTVGSFHVVEEHVLEQAPQRFLLMSLGASPFGPAIFPAT